jgi:prepilin-type N-terminal cleavage/methylation domain-containing protein
MSPGRDSSGFSLVEISLALMIVAVGLLTLFNLFPAGLRASHDATAETRSGEFADEFFNQLYADAAGCTDATNWDTKIGDSIDIGLADRIVLNTPEGRTNSVTYPLGSGETLRYTCSSGVRWSPELNVPLVMTARLSVAYGKLGGIINWYYTEFYNYGM